MGSEQEGERPTAFVYRISNSKELEELETTGFTYGGHLDKSTSCFHLSTLPQVVPTLQRFFANTDQQHDLYLLQIHANKLGDGLIYEAVDLEGEQEWFPHFYGPGPGPGPGPSRSFSPLPQDAVTKTEKLTLSNGNFTCTLLT